MLGEDRVPVAPFVRDEHFYRLLARMTARHYHKNGSLIHLAVKSACEEFTDSEMSYCEEFTDSEMSYIRDRAETFYI